MKAVTVRVRAQSRLALALAVLVALAVALLPARTLLAAPNATVGQDAATPTPAAAGHAGMNESPAHAADTSHWEKPMAPADDHAPAAPTTGAPHTDEPAHESPAAHGHADETPVAAPTSRGLVLGGFCAINGLVIAGAAIMKIRNGNKAKVRRVSPPETTPKGAAQ